MIGVSWLRRAFQISRRRENLPSLQNGRLRRALERYDNPVRLAARSIRLRGSASKVPVNGHGHPTEAVLTFRVLAFRRCKCGRSVEVGRRCSYCFPPERCEHGCLLIDSTCTVCHPAESTVPKKLPLDLKSQWEGVLEDAGLGDDAGAYLGHGEIMTGLQTDALDAVAAPSTTDPRLQLTLEEYERRINRFVLASPLELERKLGVNRGTIKRWQNRVMAALASLENPNHLHERATLGIDALADKMDTYAQLVTGIDFLFDTAAVPPAKATNTSEQDEWDAED